MDTDTAKRIAAVLSSYRELNSYRRALERIAEVSDAAVARELAKTALKVGDVAFLDPADAPAPAGTGRPHEVWRPCGACGEPIREARGDRWIQWVHVRGAAVRCVDAVGPYEVPS